MGGGNYEDSRWYEEAYPFGLDAATVEFLRALDPCVNSGDVGFVGSGSDGEDGATGP